VSDTAGQTASEDGRSNHVVKVSIVRSEGGSYFLWGSDQDKIVNLCFFDGAVRSRSAHVPHKEALLLAGEPGNHFGN
jgi:hypothetical protein